MQLGSGSLCAAANAAGTGEILLSVAMVADFVMAATLTPGVSGGSPLLARNSDHIIMTVSWLQPQVNASLSAISLSVS